MRIYLAICLFFIIIFGLNAQMMNDTTLFSFSLVDTTSKPQLLRCYGVDKMNKTLAGPVIMQDSSLLFYSQSGYILFSQDGSLIDSHSVFEKNNGRDEYVAGNYIFAGTHARDGVLYIRKTNDSENPFELILKSFSKGRIKKVKDKKFNFYNTKINGRFFNIVHNTITDEMANMLFVDDHVIGFQNQNLDKAWYSVDNFYSFLSPLLHIDGGYKSFFSGGHLARKFRGVQLANSVQVFSRKEQFMIVGINSQVGTVEDNYYQTLFTLDMAGNVLSADSILKQKNRDAIIGEDSQTYYTVKKIRNYVFQPAISKHGSVYYGIIDYVSKSISVHKRTYSGYFPSESEPDMAHLIDIEKDILFESVKIYCNAANSVGKTIPIVTFTDNKGKRVKAQKRHLAKNGYIVRISRVTLRNIEKKMARKQASLPSHVQTVKDSLSNVTTVGCPYVISLSVANRMIRDFYYGAFERVLSARVISVRENNVVVIRVDCENFAEILLINGDGVFINRFRFNTQKYTQRKDIVVCRMTGPFIEYDFENSGKEQWLKWDIARY